MQKLFLLYLIVINVLGFMIMGYDKSQASGNGQRVPEKRLFWIAAIGGALGSWLGMRTWRHKTKHASFVIGIPALLIVQLAIGVYVWLKS